jgi:XTP/dITP diphosphohydrolase
MADRLLVATTNRGKLAEISRILAGVPYELITPAEWPDLRAPEETGRTFAENARLKADFYAAATGLLAVAEDSGLAIDALGGAPGIHSARFGGRDASYAEKFDLIYKRLAGVPEAERTARFVCALALIANGRVLFEASGTVEGRIAASPKGTGGFGYDPIFYYPPFGSTLAEAGDWKHEVSHRAVAFAQLRDYLIAQPRSGSLHTQTI